MIHRSLALACGCLWAPHVFGRRAPFFNSASLRPLSALYLAHISWAALFYVSAISDCWLERRNPPLEEFHSHFPSSLQDPAPCCGSAHSQDECYQWQAWWGRQASPRRSRKRAALFRALIRPPHHILASLFLLSSWFKQPRSPCSLPSEELLCSPLFPLYLILPVSWA